MSEADIEIVKEVMDAWNRQDLDAILAVTHPDVEYVNAPEAVEPGTRRGHEGITAVMREQWKTLPSVHHEIARLHDHGEEIISEGFISGTMPGSDARIGNRILISWGVREGQVTRIQVLAAGSEFDGAVEAAGLLR